MTSAPKRRAARMPSRVKRGLLPPELLYRTTGAEFPKDLLNGDARVPAATALPIMTAGSDWIPCVVTTHLLYTTGYHRRQMTGLTPDLAR